MSDTVDFSDSVRVRNIGTTPIRGGFNGRPFRIMPNQDALLPREAAVVTFGDWTRRADHAHFPRHAELTRIRGKYGALEDDAAWEANCPQVELFEMDGTRIIPIWEDPDGTQLPDVQGNATVEQQLALMRQQMAALQAQVGEQPIPEDSPEMSQRRRSKPAQVHVPEERETG